MNDPAQRRHRILDHRKRLHVGCMIACITREHMDSCASFLDPGNRGLGGFARSVTSAQHNMLRAAVSEPPCRIKTKTAQPPGDPVARIAPDSRSQPWWYAEDDFPDMLGRRHETHGFLSLLNAEDTRRQGRKFLVRYPGQDNIEHRLKAGRFGLDDLPKVVHAIACSGPDG